MRRIRLVEIVGNGEGGGTRVVGRMVSALDPARYEVTLIAPSAPWLADLCRKHGATYHPLPLLSSRVASKIAGEVRDILTLAAPDIVNAHGTRAAWYALRALRASTIRPSLVYSEHLFSFDARRGPLRWPWLAMERYLCGHADALTTSCDANARWARAHGARPDRIALRHYGIDLEAYRAQAADPLPRGELGIADGIPLIGTVGRLIPQKGLMYLVRAAALVLEQMPDARFLVVGDGALRGQLEAQCQRLGIAEQVRFLGAYEQPWRILAHCDVIALSSIHEGLPLTGLEALAIGKPVVATRLGGTAEIIRSEWNGLLVPPRDARALATGLLRVSRDNTLRERLIANAPGSVADYRIETMIASFDALYERLATRSAPPGEREAVRARTSSAP